MKIMANENKDDWKTSPGVVLETVRVTRDYLNAELRKYETWEDAKKVNMFINLFLLSSISPILILCCSLLILHLLSVHIFPQTYMQC